MVIHPLLKRSQCPKLLEAPSIFKPLKSSEYFFLLRTCVLSHFSCVRLCETLWTVARQGPLSMGSSRHKYWNGFPYPSPGDLPNPGIGTRVSYLLNWQTGSLPLVNMYQGKIWTYFSRYLLKAFNEKKSQNRLTKIVEHFKSLQSRVKVMFDCYQFFSKASLCHVI